MRAVSYTHLAFTTPGNAQVQDDITEDGSKEFLTITTKNNNTFYLVIDRSASTENVYLLSQSDENDLQEFLKDGDVYKRQEEYLEHRLVLPQEEAFELYEYELSPEEIEAAEKEVMEDVG